MQKNIHHVEILIEIKTVGRVAFEKLCGCLIEEIYMKSFLQWTTPSPSVQK